MNNIIEVKDLCKKFYQDEKEIEVLKKVSLAVPQGSIQAIVGPSGAGKSTLLHIMGVLDRPTSGEVIFEGANIFERSDDSIASWRNGKIGFIFQMHYLLPEFSAAENVLLPFMMNSSYGKRGSKKNGMEKALSILDEVGLSDRVSHRPGELSGGEQQRVAIARALINEPALVLADEPTGNLDGKTGGLVMDLMLDLVRKKGKTFVIATHNDFLAKAADSVVRMEDGRIIGN